MVTPRGIRSTSAPYQSITWSRTATSEESRITIVVGPPGTLRQDHRVDGTSLAVRPHHHGLERAIEPLAPPHQIAMGSAEVSLLGGEQAGDVGERAELVQRAARDADGTGVGLGDASAGEHAQEAEPELGEALDQGRHHVDPPVVGTIGAVGLAVRRAHRRSDVTTTGRSCRVGSPG